MGKNWKVSLVGIVILIVILFCACGTKAEGKTEVEENYIIKFVGYCDKRENIQEWRDTETGVHYFIYSDYAGYGYAGGICPRYNANGTLYVD